jgi:hypothetical protein
MLGVLLVAFGRDWVARGVRVASELLVFFGDVRSRPADLHVRAVRFVEPGQRSVPAVATPSPPLFLTVSHWR